MTTNAERLVQQVSGQLKSEAYKSLQAKLKAHAEKMMAANKTVILLNKEAETMVQEWEEQWGTLPTSGKPEPVVAPE